MLCQRRTAITVHTENWHSGLQLQCAMLHTASIGISVIYAKLFLLIHFVPLRLCITLTIKHLLKQL